MNILHHKSWHVRNKDNIARVRRDEAKANAELQEKERKIALAEKEVKLNFLRSKAKASDRCQTIVREELNAAESESDNRKLKHINFFQDLEDGTGVSIGGNEKYLEDKKNEQEKYEKQIGYLTYLGQDTNESLGKRDWYDVAPKKIDDDRRDKLEVGLKVKDFNDPLNVIKKYLKETANLDTAKAQSGSNITKTLSPIAIQLTTVRAEKRHKKKSKKSKKHKKQKTKRRSTSPDCHRQSAEKVEKLLRLRAERLKREEIEKNRTKLLLAKYTSTTVKYPEEPEKLNSRASLAPTIIEPVRVKQKYNSQFNPEIAKQNYDDMRRY